MFVCDRRSDILATGNGLLNLIIGAPLFGGAERSRRQASRKRSFDCMFGMGAREPKESNPTKELTQSPNLPTPLEQLPTGTVKAIARAATVSRRIAAEFRSTDEKAAWQQRHTDCYTRRLSILKKTSSKTSPLVLGDIKMMDVESGGADTGDPCTGLPSWSGQDPVSGELTKPWPVVRTPVWNYPVLEGFHHLVANQDNEVTVRYSLPSNSLHTVALLGPTITQSESVLKDMYKRTGTYNPADGGLLSSSTIRQLWCLTFVNTYMMLVITYAVQLLYLYLLYDMNIDSGVFDGTASCVPGMRRYSIPSLMIFSVKVFGEYRDVFRQILWLWNSPSLKYMHPLQIKHKIVKEVAGKEGEQERTFYAVLMRADGTPWFSFASSEAWKTKGTDKSNPRGKWGLTKPLKWLGVVLVIIPRLVICTLLLLLGSAFILLASDKFSTIMKGMSSLFVLAIDDTVFNSFVQPSVKKAIENMPAASVTQKVGAHNSWSEDRVIAWIERHGLVPLMTAALVLFFGTGVEEVFCDHILS